MRCADRRRRRFAAWAILLAGLAAAPARGEKHVPCAEHDPLRRAYFGDLHVHTRYSLDASTQGTRTTPGDAYRFARGEPLGIQPWSEDATPGRSVQLRRPLDFAAVTDHAEYFGETTICNSTAFRGYDSLMCTVYRNWPRVAFALMNARRTPFALCGLQQRECRRAASLPWTDARNAAEEAYDRSAACAFTTFVGYEWTGYSHRNVLFSGAAVPKLPASSRDYPNEVGLWSFLEKHCRDSGAGCDFVVIPHNSNISSGLTFQTHKPDGAPLDPAQARRRARNEPLVEIMQHKGSSECQTGAGTADELCGFEAIPYDDLAARFVPFMKKPPAPINFTRTALGAGLLLQTQIGANPFHFGVIGSTDTHLGTAGLVYEEQYPGHGGAGIPIGDTLPDVLLDPIEYNPGGLAVLWAEENTRESLFAAMQRREAYATSGPRIVFRFFAGWDLPDDLCGRADFVARGYRHGVPMGGDLPPAPARAHAPAIAAWALQDAGVPQHPGTPLARLQVIKLWVENGEVRERVVEIAGQREPGAAVDPQTCTTSGAGQRELCAVWRDPQFDSGAPAVYYGRVVENPTCRWSTRACNQAGIDCASPSSVRRGWEGCCDPHYPKTTQERAWTSPIWYTPAEREDRQHRP
jgi:hypothetical protein